MTGVAHVSFVGGGMFVPVRTARDRESLVRSVADLIRTKGKVQVLLDGRRWLLDPKASQWRIHCEQCDRLVEMPCCEAGTATPYCLHCALTGSVIPARRTAASRLPAKLALVGT